MQQELKPDEVKKRKNQPNAGHKYCFKKNKRKGTHGIIITCAIHEKESKKQVAQLSSGVNPECESIVKGLVAELNEGKKSVDDVKGELAALKAPKQPAD